MRHFLSQKYVVAGAILALSFCAKGYAEIDRSKLIEVNAENKQRCVEFYAIDQKMYCSTEILMPAQTRIDAVNHEKFKVVFDNRHWHPAWGKHEASTTTLEYVPEGQKVESWNELITTQFQPGLQLNTTPMQYTQWLKQSLTQRGYNPDFIIHEQSPQEVILEFKVKAPKAEMQDELQRIIAGKDGMYFIHYAIRQPDMQQSHREKWFKNLKAASVK
jgi:hypothetical protein